MGTPSGGYDLRQCRVSQLDAIGRPRLDHENSPRPSGIGNASMRGVCASPPPGDLENTRCRRNRDDCTIARWLQLSAVAQKVQKRSDFSSDVRLRRVSFIEVHAGEGLLANLTAAKIRNGDLHQGRGATPDCSRRGSRATWKAGSAAHRREGFVAPPGSLARSSKTRGRARWCRPRQPRQSPHRPAALQQDQVRHGPVCGLGPAALHAGPHRSPAPEAPPLPSRCPRRHEMLQHRPGGRRSTGGDTAASATASSRKNSSVQLRPTITSRCRPL